MGIYLWLALGRSRRGRRPRALVAFAGLAAALFLPAVVLASHVFSDVPTSHTFHTNIANLAGAGVTAGCGGGKYCPEDPVTRGQMAGFLNRGLGRIAETDFLKGVIGIDATEFGAVTITPGTSPGALPGAKQFVHAQFIGLIYFSDVTGCPCSVNISLMNGAVDLHTTHVLVTVSTADFYVPISAGGVIAVTGSAPVTIKLVAVNTTSAATASTYWIAGNLVAETVPFGSTGSSTP